MRQVKTGFETKILLQLLLQYVHAMGFNLTLK